MDLIGILISYLVIGCIIITSKWFERFSKEASRKFIHIVLCNWWILAMFLFESVWYAMFVPATFVIINVLSAKYNLIPSMERDEDEGYGTVYYAVSLTILVGLTFGYINQPWIGAIGMLIMGYGDGFAAIVGKAIPYKPYQVFGSRKTVSGSLVMWICSFLISWIFFSLYTSTLGWTEALVVASVATVLEAISPKGLDNLFVPIGCSALVYMLFI